MKNIVLFSVVSVFCASSAFAADDFKGSRVGFGAVKTELEDKSLNNSTSHGTGTTFVYGYDFNKIIGVDVSFATSDISIQDNDLEWTTTKLGTDIGYAFSIKNVFLKPYAKIGYQFFHTNELNGMNYNVSDNSIYYGVGLRFEYIHFYTDLSYDMFDVSEDSNDFSINQTTISFGIKF